MGFKPGFIVQPDKKLNRVEIPRQPKVPGHFFEGLQHVRKFGLYGIDGYIHTPSLSHHRGIVKAGNSAGTMSLITHVTQEE
jgi:hypothetical protein